MVASAHALVVQAGVGSLLAGVLGVVVGTGLVAGGAYVLYVQYSKIRRAEPREGTVTDLDARPVGKAYRPVAEFRYSEDESIATGSRLHPADPLSEEYPGYARPEQQYPTKTEAIGSVEVGRGESVTVHVDPESGEAFLRPEPTRVLAGAMLVVGVVLALASLAFLIVG